MALPDRDLQAAIAATRFGLGARPGEIAAARSDPRGFLAEQTVAATPAPTRALPLARAEALQSFRQAQSAFLRANRRQSREAQDLRPEVVTQRRALREEINADLLQRASHGATTDHGFAERWALFWANHFTVGAGNFVRTATIGPYEAAAIRPHVFGAFTDLLVAAETHPAMLLYLDQNGSVGPGSPLAQQMARRKDATGRSGLNENLAREILELHTVGVDGGYTQADVIEFARALTGLTFRGFNSPTEQVGETYFRQIAHEPGPRTVMGVRYEVQGEDQAMAILRDLARRPQTARFISHKIARHFVADTPPPALVARLEKAWLGSDGALDQVALALIEAPEAWAPAPTKFKTPYEFMISSWRAAGAAPRTPGDLSMLTAMGQRPFYAPSPEGWPEDEAAWATPDGLIKRLVWTEAFAPRAIGDRDPSEVAAQALGARLSAVTARAIAGSESRGEGLALLLMSPEFQRR
ncbi:MAG: DUF1800 domain-containing protein [Phenylobacterium sp.]|uniref:DUF1800 domain-containing protein n=1 Tax=Phenylobacterium sp. TaxID=1871053 RepID=UPI00271B31F5|nr:DUF1800 domain-containing protein [Phenylobacterium sp.]MDO8902891.1 DUF1800 domain-containing protein [Phenylobacterium sp.]